MNEKIQKILANSGYGSRRYIEKMIKSNLVFVNGEKVKIGQRFLKKNIQSLNIHKSFFLFNIKKNHVY